MEFFNPF
jgi:hypothetical protein